MKYSFFTGRIALDIDDVLADFVPSLFKHYKRDLEPHDHWDSNGPTGELYQRAVQDGTWVDPNFWYNMSPLVVGDAFDNLHQLPIACYLTSSPQSMLHVRRAWLKENGFPTLPVVHAEGKGLAMYRLGVNVLFDDSLQNIRSAQREGMLGIMVKPWYSTNVPKMSDHFVYVKGFDKMEVNLGAKNTVHLHEVNPK